ncbi:MAG TPA: hypothetical protein VJ783_29595 [Pirellulales bacterium]|nr:hypothetical protein [Pirellulales bacterium]
MSKLLSAASETHQRQWFIVGRWQEFEGEARANLLRIIGIGAFYLIELANYHGLRLGALELERVAGVDQPFHQAVTALAVAWTLASLGVHFCLRRQVFPAVLKYLSTAADVVFLTAILMLADGPRSALVVGYFLIVALSALRFSLPLVRFATLASLGGYLYLLGFAKWFAEPSRGLHIERYQQLIFLLALGLTGIVLGQVVRRVRRMAEEFANRVGQRL